MSQQQEYHFHLDEKYGHSTLIDIPALVDACTDQWFNQTLCRINDCVARIGIVQGEFHWHKHDVEDEFFMTLQGKLFIDVGDETIELLPHQAYTVPRGVVHRTRAPERTVMLMIEGANVSPAGEEVKK